MKKNSTTVTVLTILLLTAVVGCYAHLSSKKKTAAWEENNVSVAESILERDLALDYPSTPKEVIKYYNQILRCFYNEECTEEEIERLGSKARELYDDDLLEKNEYDTYIFQLKSDIQDYKNKKRRISNIVVSASTNVDRYTIDGFEFARLGCGYTILEGNTSKFSNTVYLLRRDDNKRWKIYGWDLAQNVDLK